MQLYAKIAYLRNGENTRKDKEIKHDKGFIHMPWQDGGWKAFICLYRGKIWHIVADE